jgi:hypothetical protein
MQPFFRQFPDSLEDQGPSFRGTSDDPPNAASQSLEKSGAAQEWAPVFAGVMMGGICLLS